AGVVVGFDLEGDDVAAANIDDAGVFAGALDHELAPRGQLFQVQAGAFVGAVLTPHDAEDTELGVRGRAAQDGDDLLVFAFGEPMLGDEVRGDGGVNHHARTAAASI